MSWQIPGMRKRWAVLLIASLAVNLLVIGGGIGIFINWPRHHYWHAERFFGPAGLGLVARSLDERHRRSLEERIASKQRDLDEMRRAGQENLRRMVEILNAEPFDHAALDAQFAKQQDAAAVRLRTGHELIAAAIKQMTSDDRRTLSERLEQNFRRGGRK